MSIGNGGKAFPSGSSGGMSLRDYFAAQAMQKIMPDIAQGGELAMSGKTPGEIIDTAARAAYFIADAMIAARGDV